MGRGRAGPPKIPSHFVCTWPGTHFVYIGAMRVSLLLGGLFALSSLIACSAAQDDVGTSEAHVTEARTLGVVKGRELARCWFDRVGESQQLSCTSTARGSDPLALSVRAVLTGSSGFAKTLDVEAGGTVIAGSVPASTFGADRSVELQAYLGSDDTHMLGVDENDWSARMRNVDPSTVTKDSPLVISEPFDFWEIGTVYALTQGGGYSFGAHAYERDISPYTAGLVAKKVLTFTPDIASDPGKTTFIVAPKEQGPLAITWSHDGKKIETSISGPGYYALADDGIRAATPEEILANYAPVNGGTTNGGTTNGGTTNGGSDAGPVNAPPPPPPAWVDPDTTCGGDGQALGHLQQRRRP